jgi:hypothetical protein
LETALRIFIYEMAIVLSLPEAQYEVALWPKRDLT